MMQRFADYLDSLKLQQRRPEFPHKELRKAMAEESGLRLVDNDDADEEAA